MLLKSTDPPQLALENWSAGWGCLNLMAGLSCLQTQPTPTDTVGVGLCTWSCEKMAQEWSLDTRPAQGRLLYLRNNKELYGKNIRKFQCEKQQCLGWVKALPPVWNRRQVSADMATHGREGQGHSGMAQRAHTHHSDPSCQQEKMHWALGRFGVISLTRTPARGAGILQEEAAGILSLCLLLLQLLSAALGLHRTLPTAPRTSLLPGSSKGRCRFYSQDLTAVAKWYHEHDGEHEE